MRILRLDLGSGRCLDLHPFVTVLADLDRTDGHEVIEAIRRLAAGSTAGVTGLVQNQGLLVELDGLGHDRPRAITAANVVIGDEDAADRDVTWLRAEIDQQQKRAEIEAVIVEELRADLDPSARARVAALEERLAPKDHDAARELDALVERVTAAVEDVESIEPTVVEAQPGVDELRARWDHNAHRLADADEHIVQLRTAVDRAAARLTQARAILVEADDAAKPALLTRQEEARLELLSFPSMDDTRRGKWRKTLKPEEEQEKEALLAKVGVESWTAYTVYRASPAAPKERVDAAGAARAGVADAESHLAEMRAAMANDRLYAELTAETESIRVEARSFLGMMLPSDVGSALAELTLEHDNPEWIEAVHRLWTVLDELGIEPMERPTDGDLVGDTPGRAGHDLATDVVESARDWLRAQQEGDADDEVTGLEIELDRARGALDRHQRSLARIDRAEGAAATAALGLARLQEQLAACSQDRRDSVESLLSFVEPIATQVALEGRGSLPIAVVGALEGLADSETWTLMDRLSEISEGLQVVIVTDRPAVQAWVGEVGLDRAMISRARPASTLAHG